MLVQITEREWVAFDRIVRVSVEEFLKNDWICRIHYDRIDGSNGRVISCSSYEEAMGLAQDIVAKINATTGVAQ